MNKKLPGLNGLRAIAASIVLFTHVYQISGLYGDTSAEKIFNFNLHLGTNMVNLFFVISGFIITHILYKERNRTGTISLTDFYIKRILRIWPLYFGLLLLVIGITYFTNLYDHFPSINITGILVLSFFISTFFPFIKGGEVSVLPHYWSLSVEEQFYFIWPPIFKFLKDKWLYLFPIMVILGMLQLRLLFEFLNSRYPSELYGKIYVVLEISKFGSIAFGILGAYLLEKNHRYLKIIFRPVVQYIAWALFAVTIFTPLHIPHIHYELFAAVYLVIILNVTSNPATIFKMENWFFNETGKISYGIYMIHWIIIPILIVLFQRLGIWEWFVSSYQVPFVIIAYSLTWILAWLSFRYYESYFLGLKPADKKTNKAISVTGVNSSQL